MKAKIIALIILLILFCTGIIFAQDALEKTNDVVSDTTLFIEKIDNLTSLLENSTVIADTLWVLIAGMLVFFMNLGFGMVETGLQQSKNSVNISAKNFVVFSIASLAFWFIGWGLMYGDGNGFLGYKGLLMLTGLDNSPLTGDAYSGVYSALSWATVPLYAKFFFQLVFAATAATIVSGSVGGRIKFLSFIIFSFILVGIMYPILLL